jgi:putative intracellular protease/amidase
MTERDPALESFDALIGTWDTEATHPMFEGVVTGSVTYEWLEGGRFVVVHSHNEHEMFPDAISVIGAPEDGDGLVMEYFDSRGVRRTYRTSFDAGVLRVWRDDPEFAQRLEAAVEPDGFVAQYQLARTPGDWQDDLRTVYRRRR